MKITWGELIDLAKTISREEVPFDTYIWLPGGDVRKNWFKHQVLLILTQLLPALIIDALAYCFGYKPL